MPGTSQIRENSKFHNILWDLAGLEIEKLNSTFHDLKLHKMKGWNGKGYMLQVKNISLKSKLDLKVKIIDISDLTKCFQNFVTDTFHHLNISIFGWQLAIQGKLPVWIALALPSVEKILLVMMDCFSGQIGGWTPDYNLRE